MHIQFGCHAHVRVSMMTLAFTALLTLPSLAADVRVGAAAVNLASDDSMVIGGGIGPGKAVGQEGELRAVAVVIEKSGQGKLALVACDVLMLTRDLLDPVAEEV